MPWKQVLFWIATAASQPRDDEIKVSTKISEQRRRAGVALIDK